MSFASFSKLQVKCHINSSIPYSRICSFQIRNLKCCIHLLVGKITTFLQQFFYTLRMYAHLFIQVASRATRIISEVTFPRMSDFIVILFPTFKRCSNIFTWFVFPYKSIRVKSTSKVVWERCIENTQISMQKYLVSCTKDIQSQVETLTLVHWYIR